MDGSFFGNAVNGVAPAIGRFPAMLLGYIFALAVALTLFWFIDRNILQNRVAAYTERRGRIAMILSYGVMAFGMIMGIVIIGSLKDGPAPVIIAVQ